MLARVTRFSVDTARCEEASRISDTEIGPALRQQPGFRHMYVMVDPGTGDGIVLTLWEGAEHEVASRPHAGHYFGRVGHLLNAPPQPADVLEVINEA